MGEGGSIGYCKAEAPAQSDFCIKHDTVNVEDPARGAYGCFCIKYETVNAEDPARDG